MSAKSDALQVLIENAQAEARGDYSRGVKPFEGSFARPHLDRLTEALSSSDALDYLASKETK